MKPWPLVVAAVALIGGGLWWTNRDTADSPQGSASGASAGVKGSSPDGRRLLGEGTRNKTKVPSSTDGKPAIVVAPKTVLPTVKEDPLVALTGLETELMTDALTEEFQIPDHPQTGTGLLVTKVSPTSPAAESALRPKDVIMIADGKPVNTAEDLKNAVKGRTHTLLIFARDQTFHQVVLKPPYRPK